MSRSRSPYPAEFREQIVELPLRGHSPGELSAHFRTLSQPTFRIPHPEPRFSPLCDLTTERSGMKPGPCQAACETFALCLE